MNTPTPLLITALVLGLTAGAAIVQDNDAPPRRPERPPREAAPGNQVRRPLMMPLLAVLDANRDGVIDEAEINNAPAALRTLDKNKDGKLTLDELRPPRPETPDRPGWNCGPREPRPLVSGECPLRARPRRGHREPARPQHS